MKLALTLITHIYNNQRALQTQIQEWNTWPSELESVELILIDDNSDPKLNIENLPS
jgi:hypothetical protein